MSDKTTIRMINAYEQTAGTSMFFTRQFQSPPRNFHDSEEVDIDIQREDEDISIVVTDLSAGGRMNTLDIYTNKKFKPPLHDEEFTLNAWDMIKRQPGRTPYDNPEFQAAATVQFMKGMRLNERKIRRSIELQASQVMQTGKCDLKDSNGTTLYTIDYKPKSTHFPTASPVWDGVSPTIEKDLIDLCDVVRDDGLQDPDVSEWGWKAFYYAMQDADFKAKFEPRRADTGRISPMQMNDSGGQFRGVIDVGNYQLEVWTYNGKYKDPQTGNKLNYLDPTKVIVRASGGRLDATFGSIPIIVPPEQRVVRYLPPRISRPGGAMDMTTNVWVDDRGKNLFGSVGTRPLMIPTAIDTFGCIDTGITS